MLEGYYHRQLGRVKYKPQKRDLLPDPEIIIDDKFLRPPDHGIGEHILVHFKRRNQHPYKGNQHNGADSY